MIALATLILGLGFGYLAGRATQNHGLREGHTRASGINRTPNARPGGSKPRRPDHVPNVSATPRPPPSGTA